MPRPGRAFTEKQRDLIFERDGYTCAYCGDPATEVDHVEPRSIGGRNEPTNGVAVCKRCNAIKRDKLDLRWLTRGFFVALSEQPGALPAAAQTVAARGQQPARHQPPASRHVRARLARPYVGGSPSALRVLPGEPARVVPEPKSPRANNGVLISFRLPLESVAFLKELAAMKGLTLTDYLRRIVRRHIQNVRRYQQRKLHGPAS
jgi:hypothetical protein